MSSPATSPKTAIYKGRTYRLLYKGPTKYGERAHLEFTDGTSDFWVNANLVTVGAAPVEVRRTGSGSGQNDAEYTPRDRSDFHGTKTCWECGRAFTRADARAHDGDWSDSYCGC